MWCADGWGVTPSFFYSGWVRGKRKLPVLCTGARWPSRLRAPRVFRCALHRHSPLDLLAAGSCHVLPPVSQYSTGHLVRHAWPPSPLTRVTRNSYEQVGTIRKMGGRVLATQSPMLLHDSQMRELCLSIRSAMCGLIRRAVPVCVVSCVRAVSRDHWPTAPALPGSIEGPRVQRSLAYCTRSCAVLLRHP